MNAGDLIAERYRLERVLGRGGMGEVWAARHKDTGGRVALKFLLSEMVKAPAVRVRFLREAQAATAIAHPNVLKVMDVFEMPEGPVMVMELLDGEPLSGVLERKPKLSIAETARFLVPVCAGVAAAHAAGVVHRDLKPDNIFLTKDGGVRVLDFGIAKLVNLDALAAPGVNLTQDGSLMGTPYYMSPEQAVGDRTIGFRSDIWSLGIILYECLAGERPTQGETLGAILRVIMTGSIPPLAQVAPELPSELTAAVDAMLRTKAEERAISLEAISEVLKSAAMHATSGSINRISVRASPILKDLPSYLPPAPEAVSVSTANDAPPMSNSLAVPKSPSRAWMLVPVLALVGIGGYLATKRTTPAVMAPPSATPVKLADSAVPTTATETPLSELKAIPTVPEPSASASVRRGGNEGQKSPSAKSTTAAPGASSKSGTSPSGGVRVLGSSGAAPF
jgi:eukaryotic-like serine/threonine-protein kinase